MIGHICTFGKSDSDHEKIASLMIMQCNVWYLRLWMFFFVLI